MKRFVYILMIPIVLTSCSLFKPVVKVDQPKNKSPFFENIVVPLNATTGKEQREARAVSSSTYYEIKDQPNTNYLNDLQGIEYASPFAFHYALMLDVEVERISNKKLFDHITQWWGVPYRIGGTGMNGVDCSAFVMGLGSAAYGINFPRTSREQADYCKTISKEELREGDLVFFGSRNGISHVGMYLANNKFVHASTSMGVIISDLNESYWHKRFIKCGRPITNP